MYNKFTKRKTFRRRVQKGRKPFTRRVQKGRKPFTKRVQKGRKPFTKRVQKGRKPLKIKGGKAIAAGTYGCVFKPALLCKNSFFRKNGISKLMTNDEAIKELDSVSSYIIDIIKTIPNNINYFIPNSQEEFTKCDVGYLTNADLQNLNICKNFHIPISDDPAEWLNKHKNKLAIIQQADGGSEFTNTINSLTSDNFITIFSVITSKLVSLIKYGIKVMNEKGLFHLDIKPTNMVYKVIKPFPSNSDPPLLRLIDWGFAISINNISFDKIQEQLLTNTTMLNVPFSSILFNKRIIQFIQDLVKKKHNNNVIAGEIYQIFYNQAVKYKIGHLYYILANIQTIYAVPSLACTNRALCAERVMGDGAGEAIKIWKDYIKIILDTYIENDIFNAEKYFNEVYRHNVDIYGVLLTYIDIIKKNILPIRNIEDKMILFIKRYMYSPEFAIKAYNIEELVNDMQSLLSTEPASPQIVAPIVAPPPVAPPASVAPPVSPVAPPASQVQSPIPVSPLLQVSPLIPGPRQLSPLTLPVVSSSAPV